MKHFNATLISFALGEIGDSFMKTTLCICRLFLIFLLAVSTVGLVGCGGDDDADGDTLTLEQKLAGSYTLSSVEMEKDGVALSFKPPVVSGRIALNAGGGWSMALGIPDADIDESNSGASWSASATFIIYDDGTRDAYTLNGNTLVLTGESDGVKFVATFKK